MDIKNDYHYGLQKDKFKRIALSNPNLEIRILKKEDLVEMGVFEHE